MNNKIIGELFGVIVSFPFIRSEIREVVKNRNDLIKNKIANENINEIQALLDIDDNVVKFSSLLSDEQRELFFDIYSSEAIAATNISSDQILKKNEAESYHLQAQFIFNELNANLKVYGSNSALSGANPANIDLALKYIDRSLEIEPNNPIYLNLKGLLIWNGNGDKASALPFIKKAAALDPKNITIQHNLKAIEDPKGCFIATAAYGSPVAEDVNELRLFRDNYLLNTYIGRQFVKIYYKSSPPIANFIATKPILKIIIRIFLKPFIKITKLINGT